MHRSPLRSAARRRGVAVVVVFAVVVSGCWLLPPALTGAPVYDAACRKKLVASTPGTVASSAVVELSGISASHDTDGVWWAHNDSGHPAHVFAVGPDGSDRGEFDLGVTSNDIEDIAVGPGPDAGVSYLYLGDIGDNGVSRTEIAVYRVPEPEVVDPPVSPPPVLADVDTLTFTYPDGPHDAEALIVDPSTGDLVILTKDLLRGSSQVFSAAAAALVPGSPIPLVQVATVPTGVTGPAGAVTAADISPAADAIAIRTYASVQLFPRAAGTALGDAFKRRKCNGPISLAEPQGEAIGFTSDGRGYVTASEGASPQLHLFRAP